MRAKYFTADSLDEAKTQATNYFQGSPDLKIDVISGRDAGISGEGGAGIMPAEPWLILAIDGNARELADMNAFFTLYYEPDGVFLEIYRQRGQGLPFVNNDVITLIKRKNIDRLDLPAAQELMDQGSGRIKIAPAQQEKILGEDLTVSVSIDEKEAAGRLLKPEPGGTMLTPGDVKKILAESGVVHGIKDDAIEELLTKKIYGEPFVLAEATEPVDGEDGKLIFNFSTDERTGKPREADGSGRVDYRDLDLYVPVVEGQLLVTRTFATQGSEGKSVKGNVLKQKPGKETTLPRGKNVTTDLERTQMKASCSGMVEYVNNSVNVSNLYTIKGDCDISTGNIDFNGSVSISGSVRSGSTVKATDGIYIGGSVETATIISGGNVDIKGGMQGADKGFIEAKGAVSIMFIERGKISSDGPISVDVSIHSTLETGSTIHALGKRGAIIGGHANAAGDIVANYIGALSNTKTIVEVGFMPRKRARLDELEKEMEKLKADTVKLAQLDAYLAKTKGTMDQPTWDKLYTSGEANKQINKETIEMTQADIEQLRNEMSNSTKSKVHVLDSAFGGAVINIGPGVYRVTEDISYATFKYSNGEVVCVSCEKNKNEFKLKG